MRILRMFLILIAATAYTLARARRRRQAVIT